LAEHAGPFAKRQIGRDDDGRALVEPADEVEQQLAAGLCKREVAEFVENDEVQPGQMFGDPALSSAPGLYLQTVDEVDHVVETTAGAGSEGPDKKWPAADDRAFMVAGKQIAGRLPIDLVVALAEAMLNERRVERAKILEIAAPFLK
jgi:hypothetical protein